jgi:hypothetical protein
MEQLLGGFNKVEVDTIKRTFGGGGDELLHDIRNVFLQLEHKDLKLSGDVLDILKKNFLPVFRTDFSIEDEYDFYYTLPKIQEMIPEMAVLHIKAKDIEKEYTTQQFNSLLGMKPINEIILENLKNPDVPTEVRYVNMLAYINITLGFKARFKHLKNIANQKEETDEEKKIRLEKDSTQ